MRASLAASTVTPGVRRGEDILDYASKRALRVRCNGQQICDRKHNQQHLPDRPGTHCAPSSKLVVPVDHPTAHIACEMVSGYVRQCTVNRRRVLSDSVFLRARGARTAFVSGPSVSVDWPAQSLARHTHYVPRPAANCASGGFIASDERAGLSQDVTAKAQRPRLRLRKTQRRVEVPVLLDEHPSAAGAGAPTGNRGNAIIRRRTIDKAGKLTWRMASQDTAISSMERNSP